MFLDESENVDLPPFVPGPPPPPAVFPVVQGVIADAVKNLRDGKSGLVLVHERTQDGSINQTNGVFVKRFGDNIAVTAWAGHEWNKPGTVSFGGSFIWEFD